MTRPEAPQRARQRRLAALALTLSAVLLGTGGAVAASADELPTAGSISGTVTLPGGDPAVGASVNISISFGEGTAFSETAFTDATGHYEVSNLEFATYLVQASQFGFAPPSSVYTSISAAAPSQTVDFALEPLATGTGVISGHVTADGVPLADLGVSAYAGPGAGYASAVTDATGYYELTDLADGQWQVMAFAGPQYQYLPMTTATISGASPTATVDLAFVSWPVGTASISGFVVDAASGSPIASASVSVFGLDLGNTTTVFSDENGAFTLTQLPAGTYTLSVNAFGYLWASDEITVDDGGSATYTASLVAANATISGTVKQKNGIAVAGIYVSAHSASGSFGGAVTDENGNYVITDIGAVAYTLTLGGPGTPYEAVEKSVTAVANATVIANLTVKPRKTAYITGMVFGPDGDYYLAPVCVSLYSVKNKKLVATTKTFGENYGDGTYSFDEVKPGTYTVKFRDCDGDPATKFKKLYLGGVKKFKNATTITVAAAEDSYENNFTMVARG